MKSDIQKIIIDFDDTLFHTYRLKEELRAVAESFGFTQEEFWSTYKQMYDNVLGMSGYTLARHAESLHALHPAFVQTDVLEKTLSAVLDNHDFVFADARPLLDFLKKQNKILVLLSLGEPVFKCRKVESSGLAHFFDRIEFVNTPKLDVIPTLVDKDEPVYFLNDKIRETKEILERYPYWYALLRKRQDFSSDQYEESGLPYFENLSDMHSYLIAHT